MNLYNIYGHYSLQLSHNSHRLRRSRYIKNARWPKFVVLRSQVWYTFGLRPVLEWSVGDAPCWKWWAARNFDPSVKFRGAILSINWVIVAIEYSRDESLVMSWPFRSQDTRTLAVWVDVTPILAEFTASCVNCGALYASSVWFLDFLTVLSLLHNGSVQCFIVFL